jgi:hypothetical protein
VRCVADAPAENRNELIVASTKEEVNALLAADVNIRRGIPKKQRWEAISDMTATRSVKQCQDKLKKLQSRAKIYTRVEL